MGFDPGLEIDFCTDPLGFKYGTEVQGPQPELRSLDSIRASLRDPDCQGPDPVYAIAMDVACRADHAELKSHMLLFGVVVYAAGRLGREPVRSQGHVHRISGHSGWSPPELYEIWSGRAVILMQQHAADDPGRVYAVEAGPGEKILVPPGWAHAAISADEHRPLIFGALCDREFGFEYDQLQKRKGLAWYPLAIGRQDLAWECNAAYRCTALERKRPSAYTEFGVSQQEPLYTQVTRDPGRFRWVSNAGIAASLWDRFTP